MNFDNHSTRIHREVLIRVARACLAEQEGEGIDRIPLQMRPRDAAASRCCVYKDRAVLKYRCMAALGIGPEEETDELTPLTEYKQRAFKRTQPHPKLLSVLPEACGSCAHTRFVVTNACQGCLARPCTINCPKKCITFENGRAVIDGKKCVGCGLCQKVCPYHAIVKVPIPCEEACPVGAIQKNEDGREVIDPEKCIYCGKCVQACPFGAILQKSQIVEVIRNLRKNQPVFALVAPSIVGQFPGNIEQLAGALQRLGFAGTVEVALGADRTAECETEELKERLDRGDDFMTSSCCPAFVRAVEKHLPQLKPFVSHTPSPMVLTAQWITEQYPDAVKVFIGPCIAKRQEAILTESVDSVLSFEELGAMLVASDIDVAECEPLALIGEASGAGKRFAFSGGVRQAIEEAYPEDELATTCIDGLDCKIIRQMKNWAKGKAPGKFVEVMACEGGCVAGPAAVGNPTKTKKQVEKYAEMELACSVGR